MVVATSNIELYTMPPLQADDGPPSSEDGSGLHSPIYGAFPGSVRYQHHVHPPPGMLHAQFSYPPPPPSTSNASGPPYAASTSQLIPSPTTHHQHSYSSDFSFAPRNHHLTPRDYPHHPTLQGPAASPNYPPPTDHRPPNDHAFSARPTSMNTTSVSVNAPTSANINTTTAPANAPASASANQTAAQVPPEAREGRKESSNVVIACRQCRRRKIRCDSTRPVCKNCIRRNNECEYDAAPKRRGPDKCPGKRQRSCKKRTAPDSNASSSAPIASNATDASGQGAVDSFQPPPTKKRRSNAATTSNATTTKGRTHHPPIGSDGHYHLSATKGKDIDTVAIAPMTHPSDNLDHTNRIPTSPGGLQSPTSQSNINSPRSLSELEYLSKHDPTTPRQHDQHPQQHPSFVKQYPRQLDMTGMQQQTQTREEPHPKFPYPHSPTIEYNQRAWLESFTRTYPLKDIMSDISFLFTETSYWLAFINLNFLLRSLSSPTERPLLQPAFILSALAMATLMKSSELEGGTPGRNRALWLREAAQAAMDDSWSNGWIDVPLAEAAMILVFFELSAHPRHSQQRIEAAINFLDGIIRHLAVTSLDAHHQDVSTFLPDSVPVVCIESAPDFRSIAPPSRKCTCIPSPSPVNGPVSPGSQAPDPFSSCSYPLPWDATFTTNQIRDEECRRLCWCALGLVSNYTAQCTALGKATPRLFLNDPANYALLFPGEIMDRKSPAFRSPQSPSPKESIWALYCRSLLLWSFCINRIRDVDDEPGAAQLQQRPSEEQRHEWTAEAWAESSALQDALEMHDCNLDTSLMYVTREYIYNTRLIVTQSFRSMLGYNGPRAMRNGPIFSQKQAEEWLYYQDQVVKRVKIAIQHLNGGTQGYLLSRRPYNVSWFVCQLCICLSLWNQNRTIIDALELAKSILMPVDIMNTLWPSGGVQSQCDELRDRLSKACEAVGIALPDPPTYSLSPQMKNM